MKKYILKYETSVLVISLALLIPLSSGYYTASQDEGLGVDSVKLKSLSEKAQFHFDQMRYDSAVYYFRQLVGLHHNHKITPDYITATANIGNCHTYMGNYDSAYYYINSALKTAEESKTENTVFGFIYTISANYYGYTNDHERAIAEGLKALNYYSEDNPEHFPPIANTLKIIGDEKFRMGRFEEALEYTERAIETGLRGRSGKEDSETANAYYNLGKISIQAEDYEKALFYFGKASNIVSREHGEDNLYNAYCFVQTAKVYANLGQYDKAIEFGLKGVNIFKEKFGEKDENTLGFLISVAGYFRSNHQYDSAFLYLNNALKTIESLKGEKDKYLDRVYQIIGGIYYEKNEFSKAETYYKKAEKILFKYKKESPVAYANILNDRGSLAFATNQFKSALSLFHTALHYLVPEFSDSSEYAVPDISGFKYASRDVIVGLSATLKNKGAALYQLYKGDGNNKALQAAFKTYDAVLALNEKRRIGKSSFSSKKSLMNYYQSISEAALTVVRDLYHETNDKDYLYKAFSLAERSKSALLRDVVNSEKAVRFAGLPDSLIKKEEGLRSDIAFYEEEFQRAEQADDAVKKNLFGNYLFAKKSKYAKLVKYLETDFPAFFRLKNEQPIISVSEIQKNLSSDEALLEYAVTEANLFIFYIKKNDFGAKIIDIDSSLVEQITAFREQLVAPDQSIDNQFFVKKSRQLYNILIEPVFELTNDPSVRKLTIIPDGILGYIPFEVLLTEEVPNTKTAYSKLPYLLRNYSVRYGFSAALLYEPGPVRTSSSPAGYIAFAPFFKKSNDFNSSDDTFRESLAPLSYSAEETDAVDYYFSGENITGNLANEHLFKEEAKKFGIVHLATHAVTDDENPMYSKLVFGQDSAEDGYLHNYELFNLNLEAEMVILSACNTGYGKIQDGEGVMSLAWGFAYAGCPSLVMSLWSANDRSTAEVTKYFYEELVHGLNKSEALRNAKLRYLGSSDEIKSHPLYWAGLVLTGDDKPLNTPSKNRINILLILAIAVFLSLLIFIIIRRRRTK